jgi:hypothetical protein
MGDAGMEAEDLPVGRVWIESGCIECGWCTDLLPAVFEVRAGKPCIIAAAARSDGRAGANRRERSPLAKPFHDKDARFLEFVADGCPAKVIRFSG